MARAVLCGDLHLYYNGTNRDAVDTFMERLESNPPDLLVLGGDIYELWRRDLFGAGWESAKFTSLLYDLRDRGVEMAYTVGNHDEWPLRHTDAEYDYPVETMVDYDFTMDGVDYFVTHGHKYEFVYRGVTNDTLSISDDRTGEYYVDLWDERPRPPGARVASDAFTLSLGPAASFLDPTAIRQQPARIDDVERGVLEEKGDRYALYGHTHTPFVNDDLGVANWGSMAGGLRTYIEVEDGRVRLVDLS
jgi:predicted phosphodiesterase